MNEWMRKKKKTDNNKCWWRYRGKEIYIWYCYIIPGLISEGMWLSIQNRYCKPMLITALSYSSTDECILKMWYTYTTYGVLFGHEAWNFVVFRKMDETENHHMQWNKPDLEKEILHVVSQIGYLEQKIKELHECKMGLVSGWKSGTSGGQREGWRWVHMIE
jgi:hypothetical protein